MACPGCGPAPNQVLEETSDQSFRDMTELARQDLELSETSEEDQ
ncbi:hypothetical protein Pla22_11030 [Rubripirellula amarantea]|uniref:Uncharacterized protein n=1 Tax=Rubripirellula amarantea TaxID=2527999 RepID=A0A5C5WRE9_9BACT|nr:hypothetical protein Pla22_11030 [Rubripirellula amarantea]